MADFIKKITLYGNQIVDYIHLVNEVADTPFINGTYVLDYIPEWASDPQTLLLANYNSASLEAGNIIDIPESVTQFSIFREKDGVLQFIATVDSSKSAFTDYGVSNQTEYRYYIFPETVTEVGAPIVSNFETTEWWSWSLISYKDTDQENVHVIDEVWSFELDIESAPIQLNIDRKTYVGFTPFPKVGVGKNRYVTTSFSALLGGVDCVSGKYTNDNIDKRRAFGSFASSGSKFLLKDRKGTVVPCQILSVSVDTNDNLQEQITRINISIVQLGDPTEISVVNPELLE